jgi:hypothetical protein
MRFPSILTAAFLSFASLASSQDFYERPPGSEPVTHLVPPYIDQYTEGYWGFKGILNTQLLRRYGCGQFGTMLAMPAFTGEYCVSIYEIGEGDETIVYTATAAKSSQNLSAWIQQKNQGEKVDEIEVRHNSRNVSREFAVAYQRVWARAVLGARYPSKAPYPTSDGITFRFSTILSRSQEIFGEASNPEKGFCADLVDVGLRIFHFVMQDDPKNKDTEVDLIRALKTLEKQLDASPQS